MRGALVLPLRYAIPCAVILATSSAAAQPASGEDARALFRRGSILARDERCVEALPLLERSFALEPSPNSLLLVARCLRDLDRREEAWLRYGGTIEIAEWRIASGEFRYQATRDVANLEQRELGEQLATLSLHVTGADANTTLSVGPLRTPLPARGLAELRLRPGTYSLTVTRGDGTQIEKSVDLDRTQPLDLALTFPAPQAAPAAKPTRDGAFAPAPAQGRRNRALVPIGIAGLGVGALGVATFVLDRKSVV